MDLTLIKKKKKKRTGTDLNASGNTTLWTFKAKGKSGNDPSSYWRH